MSLRDCHILVVEDEYMLAVDLRNELRDAGAIVIGPEPSVTRALTRISAEARIDVAVLDVTLGDEEVYPVADALASRGIPFLFASGYGEDMVAKRYPGAITCNKPLNMQALLVAIGEALHGC